MINSIDSIMYNINQLNEKNAKVTYGLSTGNALEYGSDDSIKYSYILNVQKDVNTYDSISEGISYSSSFDSTSDATLSEIKNATEAIISELIKANTDTTAQTEKEIIAEQIEAYKTTLFNLANTQTNGEYLFSGVDSKTESFSMDSDGNVTYNSDNTVKKLNVEKGVYTNQGVNGIDVFYYEESIASNGESFSFSENQIILDEDGTQWKLLDIDSDGVYDGLYENGDETQNSLSITDNGDGTFTVNNSITSEFTVNSSTFDLLDEIINALNLTDENGNTISEEDASLIISSSLELLDTAYDAQNVAHSLLGTRTNTIENYQNTIETKLTNLKILEEEFASADLTELAVEAQSIENTYTALYSTINRINNLSLVNYLS